MSLQLSDVILQEIIDTKGNCLDSKRCPSCPFKATCLPEYLNSKPLSPQRRVNLALTVIAHHWLIESDMSVEDIKHDYTIEKN